MNKSSLLLEIDALDASIGKAIQHITCLKVGAFDEQLEIVRQESEMLVARYQELLTMIWLSGGNKHHENLSH
jgi:hypothetical protein